MLSEIKIVVRILRPRPQHWFGHHHHSPVRCGFLELTINNSNNIIINNTNNTMIMIGIRECGFNRPNSEHTHAHTERHKHNSKILFGISSRTNNKCKSFHALTLARLLLWFVHSLPHRIHLLCACVFIALCIFFLKYSGSVFMLFIYVYAK